VFSGTVLWLDPKVTVRSSDIDGGGGQSLCPRERVRRTAHNGPLGALAARVWTP
jgi:hypothetical protein